MKLADDDPLCSVDDERPVFRHEGNLTEIDFLLFDGFDALNAWFLRSHPRQQGER